WLMIIQPKRQQASKLGAQVAAEQAQLASAQSQVAQGEAARRQFASDYTELVRLGEAVPEDDNVPSLIYQLQGAAGSAHVDFRSLQVTAPSATPTPSTTSSNSKSSPSSSQSSSSSQLPPGVAVGPAGLPAEAFNFGFRGNFFRLADFFNRLQRFVQLSRSGIAISGRLMSVNGFSLSAGPGGFPQIQANVNATTYLVPASQGLTAGATGAGPAGTSTTSAGASSSSSTTPPAAALTPVIR
ncbi:MAG: hypothetical protein JO262_15195, partial [Solirubrobacterales bacterium]|nr:hypothetical protein [Solirubrobacterales bacterium]